MKYANAGECGRDFSLRKRVGEEGRMQVSPAECGRVGSYAVVHGEYFLVVRGWIMAARYYRAGKTHKNIRRKVGEYR